MEYLLGSSKKKLDTSYVAKKLSPKDFKFLVTNGILRIEESRFVFDPLFVKIILLIEENNNLYERMVGFSLSGSLNEEGPPPEVSTSFFDSEEDSEESENQLGEPVVYMDSKQLYQEFANELATLDVETLFFWNSETNMYSNPEAIPESEVDNFLGPETLQFLKSLKWSSR